jgi:hypothetical protein
MAYDDLLSQIPLTEKKQHKIMYLGDSENDILLSEKQTFQLVLSQIKDWILC